MKGTILLMKRWLKAALPALLVFLTAPAAVRAAPFCVDVRGAPVECAYYDAVQCRRRAGELEGLCVVNLKEVRLPSGYGKYCLVGPGWVASCLYTDSAGCEQDARKSGAVCALNPARRAPSEPFRFDPDAFY